MPIDPYPSLSFGSTAASIPQSANEDCVDPHSRNSPPPWSRIATLTRLLSRNRLAAVVATLFTVKIRGLLDGVAPPLDEIADCPRALEVEGTAPHVVVLVAPKLKLVKLRNVVRDDVLTHLLHHRVQILKLVAPIVPVRTAELENVPPVVLNLVRALLVRQVQGHARLALRVLNRMGVQECEVLFDRVVVHSLTVS